MAIGRTHGEVVHNGKPFDVPIVHVWEVREGKVTRFHSHIDHAVMLAAIHGRAGLLIPFRVSGHRTPSRNVRTGVKWREQK